MSSLRLKIDETACRSQEKQMKTKTFAYLMLLFTCQSIGQLFISWKKCKRTFSSTFLLLSTESSACSLSYQNNEFLFSHWFISNSIWNQRDKSWRRYSFISYREITGRVKYSVCFTHKLLCHDNKILARFLTDNKFFFIQFNLVVIEQVKENNHWNIVLIATFYSCLSTNFVPLWHR